MAYDTIELRLLGGPPEHDGQTIALPIVAGERPDALEALPPILILSCGHIYGRLGQVMGKRYVLFIYAGKEDRETAS